jgi:HAMP domain-containing protein
MKQFYYFFFGVMVFLSVAVSLFFVRGLVLNPPSVSFVKDAFDHSQWRIPLSDRIISDDQLYQYSAYRLLEGAHPFEISPEVPPIGRYVYSVGWFLGNPYYMSVLSYLVLLLMVSVLSFKLTKSRLATLAATALVAASPLLASQLGVTMMDLPLVLFLLAHVVSVHIYFERVSVAPEKGIALDQLFWLLIAGVSLGAFTSTKILLYLPVVLLADAWIFWKKRSIVPFLATMGIGGGTYLLGYTQFFIQGNSLLDWIRSFIWALRFYADSQVESIPLQIVRAIITRSYANSSLQGKIEAVDEWSLLWLVVLLGLGWFVYKIVRKNISFSSTSFYLGLMGCLYFLESMFLPFHARYFLPLIVLVVPLVVAWFWATKRTLLWLVLLQVLVCAQLVWFWGVGPHKATFGVAQALSNQNYVDLMQHLYQNPDEETGQLPARFDQLHQVIAQQVDQPLQVTARKAEIELEGYRWGQSQAKGTVHQQVTTTYGVFEFQQPVQFERKLGQWKMEWNWHVVYPDFTPACSLQVTAMERSAPLQTSDGVVLSQLQSVDLIQFNLHKAKQDATYLQDADTHLKIGYPVLEELTINQGRLRDWIGLASEYQELLGPEATVSAAARQKAEQALPAYIEPWPVYSRVINPDLPRSVQRQVYALHSRFTPGVYIGGTAELTCPQAVTSFVIAADSKPIVLEKTYQEILAESMKSTTNE